MFLFHSNNAYSFPTLSVAAFEGFGVTEMEHLKSSFTSVAEIMLCKTRF